MKSTAWKVEDIFRSGVLFWHPKSPLSPEDEHWQIECWHWLLSNFGGISALSGTDLILPTGTFFPPTEHGGHERAHHIFTCVAGYMKGGEYFFAPSATFITALGRTWKRCRETR